MYTRIIRDEKKLSPGGDTGGRVSIAAASRHQTKHQTTFWFGHLDTGGQADSSAAGAGNSQFGHPAVMSHIHYIQTSNQTSIDKKIFVNCIIYLTCLFIRVVIVQKLT